MIPYYKKYIAALIHNPNVIQDVVLEKINTKRDRTARKAITLLQNCYYLTKDSKHFTWKIGYGNYYPHLQHLYALITEKEIQTNSEELLREEILEQFADEVKCLQDIYQSIEPDKKTMNKKPMIVDLFGFVHQPEEKIFPEVYFKDIVHTGANLKCPQCSVKNGFDASKKIQFKAQLADIIKYRHQYQCQICGKLKLGDMNVTDDGLEELCECGGYYRRDKPLICKTCNSNRKLYKG
ncbi:MAG: hypothetical protein H0W75_01030 [Chitinophagaceae bacterium]|nr:hypothetical protein [Chitinophagaceae bacterium]